MDQTMFQVKITLRLMVTVRFGPDKQDGSEHKDARLDIL